MLKPSYPSEDKIPAEVRGAYVADASGVYVLDELDAEHPVVKKNKELQREKTTLAAENTKLFNAKTLLESKSIPEGYVPVKAEDAPIIEKFKASGVTLEELPTWKTAKEDLQKQIDDFQNEKVVAEVAKTKKYSDLFIRDAKEKGLKFEKTIEKVGDKDIEDFVVVKADGTKSKVDEFLKTDDFFKVGADKYQAEENGKRYIGQESGKEGETDLNMAQSHMRKRYPGIAKANTN